MMLRGIKLDFFKVAPVVVAVIAASAGLRNCVLNERARGVDADSAFHDALSALGVEVKAPGELSVPLSADTGDWAAPGFVDTLFGAMMRNEVKYGTSNVFSGVQA